MTRKTANTEIVQGNVQVQDDQVKVTPANAGASKDIPVKNAQYMIDQSTYDKEVLRNPGFGYGWNGSSDRRALRWWRRRRTAATSPAGLRW